MNVLLAEAERARTTQLYDLEEINADSRRRTWRW